MAFKEKTRDELRKMKGRDRADYEEALAKYKQKEEKLEKLKKDPNFKESGLYDANGNKVG